MTMRTLWMFMAAAALTSTACTKEFIDNDYNPTDTEGRRVQFTISEVEGRTAFGESTDGTTYPTLWNDGDQIKVNYNLAYNTENTTSLLVSDADGKNPKVTTYNNGKNASFEVALTEAVTYPCTFYAVSPASSWTHWNDTESGIFFLTEPTAQTATADSCDPKAQVLIGRSPEYPAEQKGMSLSFSHFSAYGLMSLTGLPNSAIISTVQLTAEVPIAGTLYYDVRNKTYEGSQLKKAITITTPSTQVWFGAIPVDLSGSKLTINVQTNKGIYTKEITMRSGSKLTSGRIAKFTVDFSDVTPEPTSIFYLDQVWYENNKPAGVVYWVSADGLRAKVFSTKRSATGFQWATEATTTEITANPAHDEGTSQNTTDLRTFAVQNSTIEFPMLDFLDELNQESENWYWPTRRDLETIAMRYYGVEKISQITTDYKVPKAELKTVAPELYQATVNYEGFLKEIGADPLDDAAEDTNGTTYWTSCEDSKTPTKAWYYRFGKYNGTSGAKTNKYYGRAVKEVTILERDQHLLAGADWTQQTIRTGVNLYTTQTTLFNAPQSISVLAFTPSTTNQVGIAYSKTVKTTSSQCNAVEAIAGINGGFFAEDQNAYVRIGGSTIDSGQTEMSSHYLRTYAGGALVIDGSNVDIIPLENGNTEAATLNGDDILVGGLMLVVDGVTPTLAENSEHNQTRNPRTAVGITKNGIVLFVTVDGRHSQAAGMSNFELQKLMQWLESYDAINFDGGGSTTMWIKSLGIVNYPSDNGKFDHAGERAVRSVIYLK